MLQEIEPQRENLQKTLDYLKKADRLIVDIIATSLGAANLRTAITNLGDTSSQQALREREADYSVRIGALLMECSSANIRGLLPDTVNIDLATIYQARAVKGITLQVHLPTLLADLHQRFD